jgi:PQQ-dependent catabolism-associated CXXCW motif protein
VWRTRLSIVCSALVVGSAAFAQTAPDPHFDTASGYRIGQYRAPTPQSVPNGATITLEDLQRLVRESNAVLIDVMPSDGAGADPATGAWHILKPRDHMAGSIWLPDVGKGTLTPELESYFRVNLATATQNDLARAVIVYCQADCWMSWNAIRRAATYGYTNLHWYPDGTDGMRDWDVPLVRAAPVPMTVAPSPVGR